MNHLKSNMLRLKKRARYKHGCIKTPDFYRPQRSCDQGNVFTSVCLSTGGVSRTRHPPDQTHHPPRGPGRPPRTRQTPQDQTHPPRDQADPHRDQTHHSPSTRQNPPGKQTPADGLRAAGTHPTGMHSCRGYFIDFKK